MVAKLPGQPIFCASDSLSPPKPDFAKLMSSILYLYARINGIDGHHKDLASSYLSLGFKSILFRVKKRIT